MEQPARVLREQLGRVGGAVRVGEQDRADELARDAEQSPSPRGVVRHNERRLGGGERLWLGRGRGHGVRGRPGRDQAHHQLDERRDRRVRKAVVLAGLGLGRVPVELVVRLLLRSGERRLHDVLQRGRRVDDEDLRAVEGRVEQPLQFVARLLARRTQRVRQHAIDPRGRRRRVLVVRGEDPSQSDEDAAQALHPLGALPRLLQREAVRIKRRVGAAVVQRPNRHERRRRPKGWQGVDATKPGAARGRVDAIDAARLHATARLLAI